MGWWRVWWANSAAGLYTDESPGLKVDPFVVMVLSIGFIISVVALHSELLFSTSIGTCVLLDCDV